MNKRALLPVYLLLALMLAIPASGCAAGTKTVRVGFFAFEQYHNMDEQGEKSGYGYEFVENMSIYTDWVCEYVGYSKSWADMLTMLENGEIDMLTSAQMTNERLEKFDYSRYPIGSSATILSVKAGNDRFVLGDTTAWSGIRVGMLRDNSRNDSFSAYAEQNGFTYEPVFFDSVDDMTSALQAERGIDAILTSNLRASHNEWIISQFDVSPFYVIVKKGNSALLSEIDRAIERVNLYSPALQNELFYRYYASSGTQLALEQAERDFVADAKRNGVSFNAVIKPDRMPMSGFVNGQAVGIVAQIIQRVSALTGLDIRIIQTDTQTEYEQVAMRDDVALRLDFTRDFNMAADKKLKMTTPYMSITYSAITRRNIAGAPSTAAVLRTGSVSQKFVTEHFAPENIVYYDTLGKAVQSVLDGKQDFVITDTFTAQYAVYHDPTNRLSAMLMTGLSGDVCIGVKYNQNQLLFTILNKAVSFLRGGEINAIINNATVYPDEPDTLISYIYDNPGAAIILIALFFLIAMLVVVLVMRTVRQRGEKRRADEYANLISYVCDANDDVCEIDMSGGVRYRFSMDGSRVVKEEMTDSLISDIKQHVHPDDVESVRTFFTDESLQKLKQRRARGTFTCRSLAKDGTYHWYSHVIQCIEKDGQMTDRFMMYRQDVNKTKLNDEKQKQTLKDALAQAEMASAAKGEFMSRMSHEIRTPLNAVIGYVAIAKNNLNDTDKVRACISKTEISAKHLLSIINDVLDISSIESGRMKLLYEHFDIKKLISQLTDIFYAQCSAKGLRFHVLINDVSEEWLVGDAMRLNQILLNLLSNAVKFTDKDGDVTLAITQVTANRSTVHLRFTVSDTGIGIDSEFLQRIFEPFEQQDASISKTYGGTGLGLSITKNLVSMMQGSIKVNSEKGKGTTFTVELPFALDDTVHEPTCDKPDFSHVHALIVDDEQSACEYILLLLRRCGVRAESAASGREALEAMQSAHAQGDPFNLCLMDWKMPDMDGVATARAIRAGEDGHLPIIIVSAYDLSAVQEQATAAGVSLFMAKPLFQSTVFNMLVDHFGKYRPHETDESRAEDFVGKRVLLAEDNEMNAEIATEILSQAGFEVECQKNGQDALNAFTASKNGYYDVILMDVMMPVMGGYEATKGIRASAHPQAQTIPIIAMTANAFAQDVSASLAAGMNDHITKPIDLAQLFMTLHKYIG